MRYSSARAFRQALEARLRSNYPQQDLSRFRKMIAFERLMARLDENWILKGGYALQLRTDISRATQDIDVLVQQIDQDHIAKALRDKIYQDMGDYFTFSIDRPIRQLNLESTVRLRVMASVDGRLFERFHIDIGHGDPIVGDVDYLTPPPYLDFAGIESSPIPCYPITQHIAEKVHALVQPRPVESSRVKDFVDILLFADMDENLQAERLCAAIQAAFEARGTAIPKELNHIPTNWKRKFNQFAKNLDLPFSEFVTAVRAAQEFINPILSGSCNGVWDTESWRWRDE